MNQGISLQSEVDVLNGEYEVYIRTLRAAWLSQNRINSNDVYEVMRPHERAEVHQCIARWGRYVTPLAEAWWKERGYGVIWPDDDSQPMQVYKLDEAA
jgi:hypothetical protein